MRVLIPTLLLLGFWAGEAHANAGVFGGDGQTVRLESTADVQMRSETVLIALGRGPGPFDSGVGGMDVVLYDCTFELVNLSEEETTIQVGFPLRNFQVDGSANETEAIDALISYGFVARDQDTTYHVRWARQDAEKKFSGLFLWDMTFAPKQGRTLRVRYRLPMTMTLASTVDIEARPPSAEPRWLEHLTLALLEQAGYVTETGASWAGTIEKATFKVYTEPYESWARTRGWLEGEEDPAVQDTPGIPKFKDCYVARIVSPAGWKPLHVAWRKESVGLEWTFEDFEGGPYLSVRFLFTTLPARARALDPFLRPLFGPDPSRRDLALVREILAATQGVRPTDARIKAFVEQQAWYRPHDDAAATLSPTARALLDAVDQRIATATYPILEANGEERHTEHAWQDKPLAYWVRRLAREEDERQRGPAADAIWAQGSGVVPRVQGWLEGDDAELARGAALAIGAWGRHWKVSAEVVAALADRVRSAGLEDGVRTEAAVALIAQGAAATEHLLHVLLDRDVPDDTRLFVAREADWPRFVGGAAVGRVLEAEDARLRAAALGALERTTFGMGLSCAEVIEYVKPCLLDEDAAVRRAAVGYLTEAIIFLDDRVQQEVVGLLRALAGSDPALREKALEVVDRVRAD